MAGKAHRSRAAMTAKQAIEESILRDRIVTLEFDAVVAAYLESESDASVDNGPVTEYWGRDDEGDPWRVHMDKAGCIGHPAS